MSGVVKQRHKLGVMPGQSRPKDGVLLRAYEPGIHVLRPCNSKDVDGGAFRREDGASRLSPGHDESKDANGRAQARPSLACSVPALSSGTDACRAGDH
jgi:hypothetical protein